MSGSGTSPIATPRRPSGRRPRGQMLLNGNAVTFVKFEVTNKSHFTADTWSVDLEPWQQPEGYGLTWWANAPVGNRVELLVGMLDITQNVGDVPNSLTSLITGQVDDFHCNPLTGKLTLTGRDLTAVLIDMKTSNKWPDRVSSQIVTALAQQVGLTPQVTATNTPAGELYKSSYVSLQKEIPMWDLICFLAQQEGFETFVSGTSLYFGPPVANSDPNPYMISMSGGAPRGTSIFANVETLELRRSFTFATDISVTVLSHGSFAGKSVKAVATRAGNKAPQSSANKGAGTVQNYVLRRPGLTQEQAQQLANSTLADLTQMERTFTATAEGDPTLSTHRKARVTGTGTSFDSDYYFVNVHHSLTFKGGYSVTMEAKNIPPATEPGSI